MDLKNNVMQEEAEGIKNGCQYSGDSDSVCRYLSEIVINRDDTMHAEFAAQNTIIRKHNTEVINLLTAQHSLIREIRNDVTDNVKTKILTLTTNDIDKEKRLKLLEKYAGWQDTGIRMIIAIVIAVSVVFLILKLFW